MSTLKKPIVTEKATGLNEKGQYSFEVERTANKVQIKNSLVVVAYLAPSPVIMASS